MLARVCEVYCSGRERLKKVHNPQSTLNFALIVQICVNAAEREFDWKISAVAYHYCQSA